MKTTRTSGSRLCGSVALATAVAMAMPARAQMLEEIIVSAQKREESAKDVPISIQVVSGEVLQDQQINGLGDLADWLPNVFVTEDAVAGNISIRGVSSGSNAGFEQAVPTFVDGVFHGRSRYAQSTMVDLARIEVLRGPQTIYFGNNAIGGAFSVTTRKPELEGFDGYAQASYEVEAKETAVEAALGGAVVPGKLGVRLAARYSEMDGYIKNTALGGRNPETEDKFVRLSSLLKISDDWEASFKLEHGEQDTGAPFPVQLTNCPPPAPFLVETTFSCGFALLLGQETDLDYRRASGPGEQGSLDTDEYVFRLEKSNANGLGFVAQASIAKYDYLLSADTDGTPLDFVSYSQVEEQEQREFEFRLVSAADAKIQHTLGLYLLDTDLAVGTTLNFPFATFILPGFGLDALLPFTPLAGALTLNQEERAWSAFGSATIPLSETWSLTGGLRYTKSKKTGIGTATNATANDPYGLTSTPLPAPILQFLAGLLTGINEHATAGRVEDDKLLPSITLQYQPSDDVSMYAKYSEGFKAGGLDAVELTGDPDLLVFQPETVDSFEVGIKSYLMDRSLSLNLSAFRNDYTDLQQAVPQFTATGAYISIANVGGLTSQGLEAEMVWQANDSLRLSASLALLDAQYDNYRNAGCNALQAFIAAGAGEPCSQDLSGKAPPFAPSYSGSVQADYETELGSNLKLTITGSANFSGAYYVAVDRDPNTEQDAWQKYGLRIGIGDADDRWSIALVGNNLTDEKVVASSTDVIASSGSYFELIERGRTLAVQGRVRF
ncbi:MAG: TonB-dependent receptor [Steroidobacteraceae bacterium]